MKHAAATLLISLAVASCGRDPLVQTDEPVYLPHLRARGRSNFGDVEVGQTSTVIYTFTNTGEGLFELKLMQWMDGSSDFTAEQFPDFLGPGEKVEIGVEFSPTVPGTAEGTLEIKHDAGPFDTITFLMKMRGQGVDPNE